MIATHEMTKAKMLEKFNKPYFGYTMNYPNGDSEVWIRTDLPPRVAAVVKAHEMQHVSDRAFLDGGVWWWEFRAWIAELRCSIPGTIQAIWMSYTNADRWKLYWQRMTQHF